MRKIPKSDAAQILDRCTLLGKNPYPKDLEKIRGRPRLFRTRIGQYRILYEVEEFFIGIIRVDKRSRAYLR